ncbi:hypothetical protein HBI24_127640 [Parastagonospora nodorum]|nr:hypothetical protein HBI09_043540 [Parastagonospora nodorum]KAH4547929.1 hypothetical protein HBH85_062420 [Parastagonospora nodorum]KAH4813563.1 hypothetical protein HBH61_075620 [Parastagonospora nodorum]KAH4858804.1 hypothetical protein HBH75_052570 [Parastagonospora nodorum]KAH4875952.1 hypothetical protein HBH59_089500 [Parastagonospora nodorum]
MCIGDWRKGGVGRKVRMSSLAVVGNDGVTKAAIFFQYCDKFLQHSIEDVCRLLVQCMFSSVEQLTAIHSLDEDLPNEDKSHVLPVHDRPCVIRSAEKPRMRGFHSETDL